MKKKNIMQSWHVPSNKETLREEFYSKIAEFSAGDRSVDPYPMQRIADFWLSKLDLHTEGIRREEREKIYVKVNDFLGQKHKDIPRIHPFYEGIILNIIEKGVDDSPKQSLPELTNKE